MRPRTTARGTLGSVPLIVLIVLSSLLAPAAAPAAASGGPAPTPASLAGALRALQQAELASPDPAERDYFGWSVALSGDTALIGARGATVGGAENRGAVYVFVRSAGSWTWQATLVASGGAAGDRFGYSVALSGETAVVGADVAGDADQGAVYVFTRSGTVWTERAEITVADAGLYPRFGCAVAISGDTLVAGAAWADVSGAADQGAAYIFTGAGDTWVRQARITAAGGTAADGFGRSVAVQGDTVVVGADAGGAADRGAAYVFTRGAGVWSERATLAASDGAAQDQFGISVALSGATVVVGAQAAGAADQGAAYVFTGAGSAWSPQARLTAPSSLFFGSSVAADGETVVVGAAWDPAGGDDHGAAYAFTRAAGIWTRQPRLLDADGRGNDRFGYAAAVSGGTALVGAPAEWLDGRALVFTGLQAAPATPRGRSPQGLISSRTPILKWAPAAYATSYQVRILKGTKVLASRSAVRATSWRCTVRLPRQVWLTWQVRGANAAGAGGWSAKLRFKVR